MVGVSGTGSSSKSSGLAGQHFISTEQSAQSAAATGNTFNLRAKALAVRQGYDAIAEESSPKQNRGNLDPAILARIAIEEELKKRGGGGGGMRSFNPMLWVPYSFKLLAKAIDDLRQAFNRAIDQSFNQIPNFLVRNSIEGLSAVSKFFAPITTPLASGLANLFNFMARSINDFVKNPMAVINQVLNNSLQLALSLTSSLINVLKKLIFGRDEDKEARDEETSRKESSGPLSGLLKFFIKTK